MARRILTEAFIRGLRPPEKGQTEHYDVPYPGLLLRVSAGGRKSWAIYRKGYRAKVGTWPAMTLAAAHDEWRKANAIIASGGTLGFARPQPRTRVFDKVLTDWVRLEQEGKGNKAAAQTARTVARNTLPGWKGWPIDAIEAADVAAVINRVVERGSIILARRLHAHLSSIFTWAIGQGLLKSHPMMGLRAPGKETPRERELSDREVVLIWNAAAALRPDHRDIVRLILLSGSRRQEIAGLRWGEIGDGVLTLPAERTKTNELYIIALSDMAREIVATFEPNGRETVFGVWNGKAKARLDREIARLNGGEPIPHWQLRDLRRTLATNLQRLGVRLEVSEAVLNHRGASRKGAAGVYHKHKWGIEKAAAVQAWADRFADILAGRTRDNVRDIAAERRRHG